MELSLMMAIMVEVKRTIRNFELAFISAFMIKKMNYA